ncbi:MAG: four helix bundle protein [Patescibacteria group bacterium]|jgi:four helix bundle protein
MKIERFEDIVAWQLSRELVGRVYRTMRDCRDYSFRDQLQRAVLSIMNNIAEGFDRGGNKEFIYFLKIAKGSCAEVRSMLYVGLDQRYLNEENFDQMFSLTVRISQIILRFSQSLH